MQPRRVVGYSVIRVTPIANSDLLTRREVLGMKTVKAVDSVEAVSLSAAGVMSYFGS